jgi:hypothetical protein
MPPNYQHEFKAEVDKMREAIVEDGNEIIEEDVTGFGCLFYKVRFKKKVTTGRSKK